MQKVTLLSYRIKAIKKKVKYMIILRNSGSERIYKRHFYPSICFAVNTQYRKKCTSARRGCYLPTRASAGQYNHF